MRTFLLTFIFSTVMLSQKNGDAISDIEASIKIIIEHAENKNAIEEV